MVGMEEFTVADHLAESTIFNTEASSTHEIKKFMLQRILTFLNVQYVKEDTANSFS